MPGETNLKLIGLIYLVFLSAKMANGNPVMMVAVKLAKDAMREASGDFRAYSFFGTFWKYICVCPFLKWCR